MVAKCQSEGKLIEVGKEKFAAKYREIRLKDQKVSINPATNQPQVIPSKGYSFFEADPKFFLPTHGGFDIKYEATTTMPISKPLEQQKADEMYDRLIQNPAVDPWKLAEYLIKTREKNPDDFKAQQQGQGGPAPEEGVNLQKMVDLAGVENKEMLDGKKIGPTPYASPVHTDIHISFMQSEEFKKSVPPEDKKILQIFTDHVTGEVVAQKVRGGGGMAGLMGGEAGGMPGVPGGGAMPPTGVGGEVGMEGAVPGRIQGGAEVPNGAQGAGAGIAGPGRAV